MRDRRPKLSLAVAQAAHAFGIDPSEHLYVLETLLDGCKHDPNPVLQLFEALGDKAAESARRICREATRSLKSVELDSTDLALQCLCSISA